MGGIWTSDLWSRRNQPNQWTRAIERKNSPGRQDNRSIKKTSKQAIKYEEDTDVAMALITQLSWHRTDVKFLSSHNKKEWKVSFSVRMRSHLKRQKISKDSSQSFQSRLLNIPSFSICDVTTGEPTQRDFGMSPGHTAGGPGFDSFWPSEWKYEASFVYRPF